MPKGEPKGPKGGRKVRHHCGQKRPGVRRMVGRKIGRRVIGQAGREFHHLEKEGPAVKSVSTQDGGGGEERGRGREERERGREETNREGETKNEKQSLNSPVYLACEAPATGA